MDLKEGLVVGSFCVLILAQLSLSEIFELHSPPFVIGNLGQNVVLPCQISQGIQPQNMELQWKKFGEDHDDGIYQFTAVTGQETFEPSYLGRAAMATKEGVAIGNVSLELKTIQVSDGGTYRCIIKSTHWAAESQTVLHIAALGNVSIEVLGPEGEGIKLACKSAGWYPEPELQWLPKGSQIPQLESQQDHDQLFNVRSSITVLRDTGEITCSVRERRHLQRKQEATILLSRDSFPRTSPWLLAFCVLFILTLLLPVGVVLYYKYKERLKASKTKQDEEEQGVKEPEKTSMLSEDNKEQNTKPDSLEIAEEPVNHDQSQKHVQDQQSRKLRHKVSLKPVRKFFNRITS